VITNPIKANEFFTQHDTQNLQELNDVIDIRQWKLQTLRTDWIEVISLKLQQSHA